jgi:predicted RNase H-like HicB family nuclease
MAKLRYIAILEVGPDGYDVRFPDLAGCVSFGADADDAVRNAREALSIHLEGLAAGGVALPTPSDLRSILPEIKAAWEQARVPALYATVEVEAPDQGERVNVYLAKNLLERVDAYCEREGLNRSAFFAQAASAQLAAVRPPSPEEVGAAIRVLAGDLLNATGEAPGRRSMVPNTPPRLPPETRFQRQVLTTMRPPPPIELPINIDGRQAIAVLSRWLRNAG